jgi:hypothetical protein
VDLEETAQISFDGGSGSEMLAAIVAMVKRTQRSNLVSGLPTVSAQGAPRYEFVNIGPGISTVYVQNRPLTLC